MKVSSKKKFKKAEEKTEIVQFQTKLYNHPMEGHQKKSYREGVLKVKILEAKYSCMKLNWKFLGGGGGYKTKSLPWGENGYILERTF